MGDLEIGGSVILKRILKKWCEDTSWILTAQKRIQGHALVFYLVLVYLTMLSVAHIASDDRMISE
jgi:hypothetical protein